MRSCIGHGVLSRYRGYFLVFNVLNYNNLCLLIKSTQREQEILNNEILIYTYKSKMCVSQ